MPEYQCSQCGAKVQIDRAFPGLLLSAPEKEAVLRLAPFFIPCGVCGASVQIPVPALYIDERFIVRLTPPGFEPLHVPPTKPPILRDTKDILSFREKIVILNAGYDDRAVEILKLVSEKANEDDPISDLIVTDADADGLTIYALKKDNADILFRSPRGFYDQIAGSMRGHLAETASIDREWAKSHTRLGIS